ncbi:MAG: hypothetical protein KF886_00830 [Candidatus Hydrogenedentes bacterium]|nr:hypothetical protein [Candidatus Hydrogenedentota bacterium]
MYEELDQTIAALENTSAGWVNRRDAAAALGEYIRRARAALEAHANEKDVDVRGSVVEALKTAASPAAPAATSATPAPPTMRELARACYRKSRREVKPEGDGFVVRVQARDGRAQDVRIDRTTQADGREIIRVSTECAAADPETIAWAIRNHARFTYCAFCVEERGGVERLILACNFEPDLVSPAQVKNAVKEAAHYGDWLEKKLTGQDEH